MTNDPHATTHSHGDSVELPRSTLAPLVLGIGLGLCGLAIATSLWFLVTGLVIFFFGLGLWIGELRPGVGHVHEPMVPVAERATPPISQAGRVGHLRPGMPGYRFRLPEKVHPISAGIKGGIVGGLLMPIPAILWGLIAHRSIWYPGNLLAGMVLPGVEDMTVPQLEQFQPTLFIVSLFIHAIVSVVMGLIYGVLLPTLPELPREVAWGGLMMPVFWSGLSYGLLSSVNPRMRDELDWPSFMLAQIVFGIATALIVRRFHRVHPIASGVIGGGIAGLLMAAPAALWGLGSGRGLFYPVNVLAGMVVKEVGMATPEQLAAFHPSWFAAAIGVHAAMSLGFGLLYGLVLPKLPPVPAPFPWGAILLPLLWTGASYGLMGVVNPVLQERVDWPWYVVSQFVFGIAAAIVVIRTEQVAIPPAGRGEDSVGEFVTG